MRRARDDALQHAAFDVAQVKDRPLRPLEPHRDAARGELQEWRDSAEGSLALLLLLDQFPRNAFRGTPRVYAAVPGASVTGSWTSARAPARR